MLRLLAIFLFLLPNIASAQSEVAACGDQAGWPPFHSLKKPGSKAARGATVALVEEVAKELGIKLRIDLIDWQSCFRLVKEGKRYDFMLDVSRNPQRDRDFLVGKPLYDIAHVFYYRPSRFPLGPGIKTTADINKFKVCGLRGYNFGVYKFDHKAIDQGATDGAALFNKLRRDRCDLVIGYKSIVNHLAATKKLSLEDTAMTAIPEAPSLSFHLMYAQGEQELMKKMEAGIEKRRKQGSLRHFYKTQGVDFGDAMVSR